MVVLCLSSFAHFCVPNTIIEILTFSATPHFEGEKCDPLLMSIDLVFPMARSMTIRLCSCSTVMARTCSTPLPGKLPRTLRSAMLMSSRNFSMWRPSIGSASVAIRSRTTTHWYARMRRLKIRTREFVSFIKRRKRHASSSSASAAHPASLRPSTSPLATRFSAGTEMSQRRDQRRNICL